jgi:DUF1009 family protein
MLQAEPTRKLGIIAGSGLLPAQIIESCKATGRDYFILGIEGHADAALLADSPHRMVRLGALNDSLTALREHHVQDILLAGRVGRPSIASLRPDLTATKLIARLGKKIFNGDDSLLKSVIHYLEEEGFNVVSAQDILQSLIAPAAVLSKRKPTEQELADIKIGFNAAHTLGALDIGQAVVIENGYILAVEAAEGTDGLLARTLALKQYDAGVGILVKCKKPTQEKRADLPTIGPDTIESVHKAGLAGIAVEAGHSIILDQKKLIERADALSLFVVGCTHD